MALTKAATSTQMEESRCREEEKPKTARNAIKSITPKEHLILESIRTYK